MCAACLGDNKQQTQPRWGDQTVVRLFSSGSGTQRRSLPGPASTSFTAALWPICCLGGSELTVSSRAQGPAAPTLPQTGWGGGGMEVGLSTVNLWKGSSLQSTVDNGSSVRAPSCPSGYYLEHFCSRNVAVHICIQ